MTTKTVLGIPLNLLILDFLGALMVALGILETSEPGSLWPTSYAFAGYNLIFIVVGSLLMLPLVLHMVAKAKQQAANSQKKPTVERKKF
jgi:multisubunit Na+/H+ antiporter MnhG subunit